MTIKSMSSLDIYFNGTEIYFCVQKLYMSHIYFIFMRVKCVLFRFHM